MTLDPKVRVELPSQGAIVRRSGKHPTVYKVTGTFRTVDGGPDNRGVWGFRKNQNYYHY
jgi:hypothetical protein